MKKIVMVQYDVYYCEFDCSKITDMIPETEWLEVTDDEYTAFADYVNLSYERIGNDKYKKLMLIELYVSNKGEEQLKTKDMILEWNKELTKKKELEAEKNKQKALKAKETKKKNTEKQKREQLAQLAKELGVEIKA